MAPRIRSLKPEIWQDEALGALPISTRLLYVGLITQADDEGRFRAAPALVRSQVFPYDESLSTRRVDEWLAALGEAGMLRLYTVNSERYGEFPTWDKHQKVDHPTASRMPTSEHPQAALLATSLPDSAEPREDSRILAPDQEGKGSGPGRDQDPSYSSNDETQKPRDTEASFTQVYDHWQHQPALITHRQPTAGMRRATKRALNEHTLADTLAAIELYNTILTSTRHYFSHVWTLEEFLTRGLGKFTPETQPLTRFYGTHNGNHADKPDTDRGALIDQAKRMYQRELDDGQSPAEARLTVEYEFRRDPSIVTEAISQPTHSSTDVDL